MKKTEEIKNKEKKETKKQKEDDFLWDIFFRLCIIITVIFTLVMGIEINKHIKKIRKFNTSYDWPKFSDLKYSLFLLPLIMAYKTIIEYFSKGFVERCLAKKYKEPKNEEFRKLGIIYRHKLARHIYKFSFYFFITIFGYYILHDLPYFPKSMLGKGHISNMFIKDYPDFYFYEKPPLFNFYYNINLAYFVNDFIFLFIMERQSDFIKMFLHHICTISLIIFSFIINYLHIGALVLFCHMESDILMHITRFLLQTDNPLILVGTVGILFTINFVYMRQFVLGQLIYSFYTYPKFKLNIVDFSLLLFLVILFLLHIHWSYILIYKSIELLMTRKKIVDDINYNKLVKENNKENINKKLD